MIDRSIIQQSIICMNTMEWPDFQYSPFDEECLQALLEDDAVAGAGAGAGWSFEENKMFENALADMDPSCPEFFENIGSRVPWKSNEDIRNHYHALVEDINMIESGNFPIPDYSSFEKQQEDYNKTIEEEGFGSPSEELSNNNKTRNGGQHRRRGVPWTEEEHQLFLMGLNKYGKGDWRSISRYYVITKTPTQVASHAQKYFRRQTSSTPPDRRRPSIHDIQSVNPTTTTTTTLINEPPVIPFFSSASSSSSSSCGLPINNNPIMLHDHHHHHNSFGINDEQNPNVFNMINSAATFPSSSADHQHHLFTTGQASAASYFLSGNAQYWG